LLTLVELIKMAVTMIEKMVVITVTKFLDTKI